ncbi:HAD family phosphatase [Bacillus sp. A116_S68]|nr:HAD family phosphatase [Bacillus sp. A116_S68]
MSLNKIPEIKLIALDMDGTLLNDDHLVSDRVRQAIYEAQAKGIHVVLSTGRSLAACEEYAKDLKLTSYLITGNGSEIWHVSGELVERNLLKTDLIEMLYKLKHEHRADHWAASVDRVWRNDMPEDLFSREWLKFGFQIEDDTVRQTLFDLLSKHDELEVTNSSLTNIEINAAGVNKAVALAKLCSKLDCQMENTLAIGDSLNDMAMIKEAGIGVAMGNAQYALKKEADWVSSSNNEDGVAKAIYRFALKPVS